MGLREKILAHKVPESVIETPDGKVLVIGQTVAQRSAYQMRAAGLEDGKEIGWREALVIMSAYDPKSREPLFTWDDADAIGALPASLIEPIVDEAIKLSPSGDSALEEAEGN